MSKEVNELLDKLGKLEDAPLIWINKKVYDASKEIERLKNQLQQKENIIKEVKDLFYEKCRLKDSDGRYSFNETDIADFRNLLDKGE